MKIDLRGVDSELKCFSMVRANGWVGPEGRNCSSIEKRAVNDKQPWLEEIPHPDGEEDSITIRKGSDPSYERVHGISIHVGQRNLCGEEKRSSSKAMVLKYLFQCFQVPEVATDGKIFRT